MRCYAGAAVFGIDLSNRRGDVIHSTRESIMVKKSHAPTGGLPAVITGSANQIFLAGLGAFAKAQEDGTKIFDTLVEEGTKVFNGLVAGVEAVRGRAVGVAEDTMAEMKAAASGTWNMLEGMLERHVTGVLQGLNVATKKDIDTLARRVAQLGAKKPSATRKKSPAKSARSRGVRKSRARKRK